MRTPRHSEAAKLRDSGLSYRAIADRLQVPLATAYRWSKPSPGSTQGSSPGLGGAVVKAHVWVSDTLPQNTVDLSTPEAVLGEIDAVYALIATRGYSAGAALQIRALSLKLDGLRRVEPSPCASHVSVTAVDRRVRELVAVVMQEFQNAVGTAEPGGREYVTTAVEALFERCKTRFNGTLRSFNEEDKWNDGNLVD